MEFMTTFVKNSWTPLKHEFPNHNLETAFFAGFHMIANQIRKFANTSKAQASFPQKKELFKETPGYETGGIDSRVDFYFRFAE